MRRRIGVLAVAALSLVALGIVHHLGGGPPLYDSVCTPGVYRLLGSNPAPPSASAVYSASELMQPEALADDQNAIQAQIIMASGTLTPVAGASAITVSITPVRPPAAAPDGAIDGNVYDFEASSAGEPVQAASGHEVTISLAATSSGAATPTLEHFDGRHWSALTTIRSGCGSTFSAASPSLGLFALVAKGASAPPGPGGGSPQGSVPLVLAIVAAVVVLLALVVTRSRISRDG